MAASITTEDAVPPKACAAVVVALLKQSDYHTSFKEISTNQMNSKYD
jgi:hypothetical protein